MLYIPSMMIIYNKAPYFVLHVQPNQKTMSWSQMFDGWGHSLELEH